MSDDLAPFVGGGSVALAMAEHYPTVKLILNDLDQDMAAFWDLVAAAPNSELQKLDDCILRNPTRALQAGSQWAGIWQFRAVLARIAGRSG